MLSALPWSVLKASCVVSCIKDCKLLCAHTEDASKPMNYPALTLKMRPNQWTTLRSHWRCVQTYELPCAHTEDAFKPMNYPALTLKMRSNLWTTLRSHWRCVQTYELPCTHTEDASKPMNYPALTLTKGSQFSHCEQYVTNPDHHYRHPKVQ